MTQCAILGVPGSEEVDWLDMRLEERGAARAVLDTRQPPALVLDGERVEAQGHDLSKLRSVFVRDLGLPSPQVAGPDGRLDPAASRAALRASREHLAAWNLLLEVLEARGVRVVNPVPTHEVHALKPWELDLHGRAGAPVPATVTTTRGAGLATAPPPSRSGAWIQKGLTGGRGYTEPFDPAEATDGGPALLVQERIEGVNVRAYVVGLRVVGAAAVHTVDGGETDSRRGRTRVQKVQLPPAAERAAVEATARLGMRFSAVDFMREDATGRFVLLECNSSPFFVAFEQMTGLPVSSALADLLVDRMPRFAQPDGAAARA